MNIKQINIESLESVLTSDRTKLPSILALYFVISEGVVLYVGATGNLKRRWYTHKLKDLTAKISWLPFDIAADLVTLEKAAIEFFRPEYNSEMYSSPKIADSKILTIDKVLAAQNKSAYWLSKETGLPYGTIHRLCTKKVRQVSLKAIAQICGALNCSINEIIPIRPRP